MFTIEKILQEHSHVKSGEDFPAFVQKIQKMGVKSYETIVKDGHTTYIGENGYHVSTHEKYDVLVVSETVDSEQFKADLLSHQQGNTNYMQFCEDCAKSGIEKWKVIIEDKTCTYYDVAEKNVLTESIPI